MTNARQKILNYLIEQKSATVEELARVFRVTPANIRHHLSILTAQGAIEIIGQKDPAFRGRPSQIYSCRLGTKSNLLSLSQVLLSILLTDHDQAEMAQHLKLVASQMVANFSLDTVNPTRRLYSSMHILNQMNYQAHWEAHIENPRIILSHCPYNSLQEIQPEICQVDGFILEELLGSPVRQVEKLSPNEKCLPQCVFLLHQPT
jgi:predicted ArsR family transcriptional regulator